MTPAAASVPDVWGEVTRLLALVEEGAPTCVQVDAAADLRAALEATRRCATCSTPIDPHRHWCSRSCHRADEGHD